MTTPIEKQTTDTTKDEKWTPEPGEWGYKSPAEIEELKRQWRGDAHWDLEETFGFAAYYDELKAYRVATEAEWAAKTELAAKLAAPFVTDGPYGLRLENIEAIRAQANGVLVLWPGHGPSNMEICVSGEYAKALWKKLTGTEWPTPPENKPEPASADNPLYDEDGAIIDMPEPLNSNGSLYPYEAPATALRTNDEGAERMPFPPGSWQ